MTLLLRTLLPLVAALSVLATDAGAQQRADTADATSPVAASGTATPRPGDRIALKIWNEPEMSDTFNISERGEAILPKLGVMHVTALPLAALQDSLRRAYAVYLRNPSVEIVVLRRVSVQGEVRQPGVYMADLTMGLPEIVARAGGYTEAGNPRNIVIVRDGERFRYGSGTQTGPLVADLQSGDQIFVRPRSAFSRNPTAAILGAISVVGAFRLTVWPMIESFFDDDDGNP